MDFKHCFGSVIFISLLTQYDVGSHIINVPKTLLETVHIYLCKAFLFDIFPNLVSTNLM